MEVCERRGSAGLPRARDVRPRRRLSRIVECLPAGPGALHTGERSRHRLCDAGGNLSPPQCGRGAELAVLYLIPAAELAAVTLWLGIASWPFQTHFAGRADAAREQEWRGRTQAILAAATIPAFPAGTALVTWQSRLAEGDLEAVRQRGGKWLIDAHGPPVQVANSVDYAVRRIGLSYVALSSGDRESLYWLVFELVRRGYSRDEILVLLGRVEQHAKLQKLEIR